MTSVLNQQQPQYNELTEWYPRFADKWKQIFPQLMSKYDYMIPTISKDKGTCEECCEEMLRLWCDSYPNRTWDDLINALETSSVRKIALANEIAQHLAAQRSRHITTMQEQPVASQMIDRTQKQSQQKQAVLPAITELETDGNSLVHNVDDGAHSEGKKTKKSMYPVMSEKDPPCAIIINNEEFVTLKKRSWSESDVQKIKEFGKMIGIHFNIYNNLSAQRMEDVCTMAKCGLSKDNSGLLVFIMTHGTTDDRLYGSDGNPIPLKQIAEIFEINKCPLLKDKPKIFIIHACRGDGVEPVHTQQAHTEGPPPASNVTPQKADFLFVYSTTDGCVAYGQKETGFISKLVDNLKKNFNNKHLEDVLLDVKNDVAGENYCEKGKYYKQMPSVVSQMRDKVWFAK